MARALAQTADDGIPPEGRKETKAAGAPPQAAGSARQAVSLTASPAGPLPPGCIGQVMPEAWVGSVGAG